MKNIFLLILSVSLCFVLSGCSSNQRTFDEMYDDLLDDYAEEVALREKAETKYELLLKNVNSVYDEFLFVHQYLLGADDISEARAKDASNYVHDLLELIRWDD